MKEGVQGGSPKIYGGWWNSIARPSYFGTQTSYLASIYGRILMLAVGWLMEGLWTLWRNLIFWRRIFTEIILKKNMEVISLIRSGICSVLSIWGGGIFHKNSTRLFLTELVFSPAFRNRNNQGLMKEFISQGVLG